MKKTENQSVPFQKGDVTETGVPVKVRPRTTIRLRNTVYKTSDNKFLVQALALGCFPT